MLKSMTAFGRACVSSPLGRFVVEIQSVNRKHLEINTWLPRELVRFDSDIKEWISSCVSRGHLNVKVSAAFEKDSPLIVTPNIPLARQIKEALNQIAVALELPPEEGFRLSMLAKEPGILMYDEEIEEEETFRTVLKQAVDEALERLVAMKVREGDALQEDISQRLLTMRLAMETIAEKAPGATERYRQKLIEKLEEVLAGRLENEEKILREVCVYAERIDIAEELTRFDSHLKQFDELLSGQKEGIGKTLEFLVQELNREVNTMGSKSSDVVVTKKVIEIKSELEKIREQIQNVE